jgi:hypothetical protein
VAALAQEKKQAKQEHEPEYSKILPNPAFDKIKGLEGEWIGTVGGTSSKMSYKVVSDGSAVMLVMEGHGPSDEMITMFHPDGEQLLMTHYCSAKNQPRMKFVKGDDPNVLRFEFLDATNLADPKIGHMAGLTLKLLDANHHIQEWTFREAGKEETATFDIRRKM